MSSEFVVSLPAAVGEDSFLLDVRVVARVTHVELPDRIGWTVRTTMGEEFITTPDGYGDLEKKLSEIRDNFPTLDKLRLTLVTYTLNADGTIPHPDFVCNAAVYLCRLQGDKAQIYVRGGEKTIEVTAQTATYMMI